MMLRHVSAAVLLAVLAGTGPAPAQFGTIFGDPPRPPGSVPGGRAPVDRLPPPPGLERAPNELPPPPPRGSQGQPGGFGQQGQPGGFGQQGGFGREPGIESQTLPPPPGSPAATAPAQQQVTRPPAQLPPGAPPGQQPPPQAPQQQEAATPPPDEVVQEMPTQKIANPNAVFAGLDKITGRIISFDVAINETVQFGALQVTPRVCYTRPPTETPNTDAFIEVDEVTLQGEVKRIFTGWMFAASPGLHAVEHPIYDIWLTDCKGGTPPAVAEAPAEPAPPPPQQRPARPRQQPQRRVEPPVQRPPDVLPPFR